MSRVFATECLWMWICNHLSQTLTLRAMCMVNVPESSSRREPDHPNNHWVRDSASLLPVGTT